MPEQVRPDPTVSASLAVELVLRVIPIVHAWLWDGQIVRCELAVIYLLLAAFLTAGKGSFMLKLILYVDCNAVNDLLELFVTASFCAREPILDVVPDVRHRKGRRQGRVWRL